MAGSSRGQWKGFSSEIETSTEIYLGHKATGGQWKGFSSEIETRQHCANEYNFRCGQWKGFSSEIETHLLLHMPSLTLEWPMEGLLV